MLLVRLAHFDPDAEMQGSAENESRMPFPNLIENREVSPGRPPLRSGLVGGRAAPAEAVVHDRGGGGVRRPAILRPPPRRAWPRFLFPARRPGSPLAARVQGLPLRPDAPRFPSADAGGVAGAVFWFENIRRNSFCEIHYIVHHGST